MELRNTSWRLGSAITVAFTTGASSVSSALFAGRQNGLYVLRVQADQDCTIAVGASPTATASSSAFSAGRAEYIVLAPGEQVAVLGKTASGTLSLTEVS